MTDAVQIQLIKEVVQGAVTIVGSYFAYLAWARSKANGIGIDQAKTAAATAAVKTEAIHDRVQDTTMSVEATRAEFARALDETVRSREALIASLRESLAVSRAMMAPPSAPPPPAPVEVRVESQGPIREPEEKAEK